MNIKPPFEAQVGATSQTLSAALSMSPSICILSADHAVVVTSLLSDHCGVSDVSRRLCAQALRASS